MPAKTKTKRDVSPHARGHLVTARDPILGGREAKYILDITDLDDAIMTTLHKIRERDGTKWCKEGARRLRDGLDMMIAG
jgi:hypothetical protein